MGTAAVAGDSVAAANIEAIYQPASGQNIDPMGAKTTPVSLLDGKLQEWRDPTTVNLGLDASSSVVNSDQDNVALENIREIFNAYSAD